MVWGGVALTLQLHISKNLSQVSRLGLEHASLFGIEGRGFFSSFFFFLPCTSATRLTAGQSNPLQSGHVTGRLPALTLPQFSRNSLTLCCWSLACPAFSQQPSWPLNCCSFVVRRHSKLNTQQKESPTPWDTHLFFISLGRG